MALVKIKKKKPMKTFPQMGTLASTMNKGVSAMKAPMNKAVKTGVTGK